MIEVMQEKETYLSQFARLEGRLAGHRQPWFYPTRKAVIAHFAELGFPTTRHEEWKFANVAPLSKIPFRPVEGSELDGVTDESLKRFTFGGLDCTQLVFVNGRFAEGLSTIRPLHNGMKEEASPPLWTRIASGWNPTSPVTPATRTRPLSR